MSGLLLEIKEFSKKWPTAPGTAHRPGLSSPLTLPTELRPPCVAQDGWTAEIAPPPKPVYRKGAFVLSGWTFIGGGGRCPLPKADIFEFAHKYGVPYLKDTTGRWSTRGAMRNDLMPLLQVQSPASG